MPANHESFFTYAVSRPYPYKWFTPVVIVGFVAAAALFSLLNVASNGYDLRVEISSDPNDTITSNAVFKNWPSYFTSRIQPSCQPVDFHVNTQLFTNQTGLTYTLTDVWRPSQNDTREIFSSVPYMNNKLEDCTIGSIEVDLEALDRAANQVAFAEWGANVRAYMLCTVQVAGGAARMNLTMEYDFVPPTMSFAGLKPVNNSFRGAGFRARDRQNRASLYWGESLMSVYYAYLTTVMQDIRVSMTSGGLTGIRKGTLAFVRDENATSDISSLDFFSVDYRFVVDETRGHFRMVFPGQYNESRSIGDLDRRAAYPNIWIPADTLVKSTYASILTDLGQPATPQNLLTDPDLLKHFTSNFSEAAQHKANAQPGPLTEAYATAGATTGPLGTTPSVLSTTYICETPQLKSGGNLVVSVLLADLVFLQALWKLFTLAVGGFALRKRPRAGYCEGCLAALREDTLELIPATPASHSAGQNGDVIDVARLQSAAPSRRASHRSESSQQMLLASHQDE